MDIKGKTFLYRFLNKFAPPPVEAAQPLVWHAEKHLHHYYSVLYSE